MILDNQPISFSTLFSLALHGILILALTQTQPFVQASGSGLEIELISSTYVSNQIETEQASANPGQTEQKQHPVEESRDHNQPQVPEKLSRAVIPETVAPPSKPVAEPGNNNESAGEQARTRSTNSTGDSRSIIELLHSKISEHKRYPYLARRQRREGVATVEFVLHPDGRIDNTRLIHSSRTRSLDKAALDAVKGIEPFMPAGDFIDRPEAYQVDIVFNVL